MARAGSRSLVAWGQAFLSLFALWKVLQWLHANGVASDARVRWQAARELDLGGDPKLQYLVGLLRELFPRTERR